MNTHKAAIIGAALFGAAALGYAEDNVNKPEADSLEDVLTSVSQEQSILDVEETVPVDLEGLLAEDASAEIDEVAAPDKDVALDQLMEAPEGENSLPEGEGPLLAQASMPTPVEDPEIASDENQEEDSSAPLGRLDIGSFSYANEEWTYLGSDGVGEVFDADISGYKIGQVVVTSSVEPFFFEVSNMSNIAVSFEYGATEVALKPNGTIAFETLPSMEVSEQMADAVNGYASEAEMAELSVREKEALKYLSAPDQKFMFLETPVSQVLHTLARAAGIPYKIAGSVDAGESGVKITGEFIGNPFRLAEIIGSQHGFALDFDRELFVFRPYAEEGLVGVNYKLQYGDGDAPDVEADKVFSTSGGEGAGAGIGASGGNQSLNAPTKVFKYDDEPSIVEDIRELLKLTAPGVVFKGEGIDGIPGDFVVPNDGEFNVEGRARTESSAFYIPKTRSIFVVATRQQHEWVRGYIEAMDKPQKLIVFHVRFVETRENIVDALGFHFAAKEDNGMYEGGFGTQQFSSDGEETPSFPNIGRQLLTSPADLARGISEGSVNPFTVIFDDEETSVIFQALESDGDVLSIEDISTVVVEGREGATRSVTLEPVAGGSTGSFGQEVTTTSSSRKEMFGTTMNLQAQILKDNLISLEMLLTVRTKVGTKLVREGQGEEPIISSRDFSTPSMVHAGKTLALGGFEMDSVENRTEAVPVLGKIPGIGRLFRNEASNRTKRYLMVFITPHVMDSYSGGVGDKPLATQLGRRDFRGYVQGVARTVSDMDYMAGGLMAMVDDLYRDIENAGNTGKTIGELERLLVQVSQMADDLRSIRMSDGDPRGRELASMLETVRERIAFLIRLQKATA